MIACYDLHRRLPTYDFFTWLTHVKVLGASEITFSMSPKLLMRKKWPHEETYKRLENFLLPGPALAGLPARMGDDGDREIGTDFLTDELWQDVVAAGIELPRLKSIWPPGTARYTVTIREHFWVPEKNSGPVWRKFANAIGARIIEDTSRVPIGLYERVALYAGAEMNFGVTNGPLGLLYYTDYPFCVVADPAVTAMDWRRQGTAIGSQLPWFLPTQRIVWGEPTMDMLMAQLP